MIIDKIKSYTTLINFKHCTDCNKEIEFPLWCSMCNKPMCPVCDNKAYNTLTLCTKCWDAGKAQRERINILEYEIEALYKEWRGKCQ